ncbi:MAG: hypothetical protein H7256_13240 [Bdellovibrio sp.]|nr:hypothetical protein [Bdellovibrio sp.]
MKILSSFFLVISFCFSVVFASSAKSIKLSWKTETFNSLSESDKMKFIRDLREVMVLMDEKSDFFTNLEMKTPSWFSFAQTVLFQQCLAQSASDTYEADSKVKVKSYKTESYIEASQMAFKEFVEANKSNPKKELSEAEAQKVKTALTFLVGEAKRTENSSDEKARQALVTQFADLKNKISEYNIPSGTRKTVNGIDAVFYKINKLQNPESANRDKTDKKEKEADGKKRKTKHKQENKVKKLTEDEQKKVDSEYTFSACLYAGFVIQEKVCKAPKTLPRNELLNSSLDEKTFKCESSEEIICNPILFGYEGDCGVVTPKTKEEAAEMIRKDSIIYKKQKDDDLKKCLTTVKPVCVPNSVSATMSCQQKTKSGNYLKKAVDVISTNPQMLTDYVKSFDQLCAEDAMTKNRLIYRKENGELRKNSDSIKKDIVGTCAVAKPKMKEVLENYTSRALNLPAPGQKMISTEKTGTSK